MKTIEETYEPYNFTENHTYIFTVLLADTIYTNIQHKLPAHIKTITGLFVTAIAKGKKNALTGILSLCFNGLAFKSIRIPVSSTFFIRDCSIPLELNEEMKPNSFIQGYFLLSEGIADPEGRSSESATIINDQIQIYIHYKP